MINHFKQLHEEPFTGLKVILGSYTIHRLDGNSHVLKHLMKSLVKNMQGPHPFYTAGWVLHFVDECPSKIFSQWFCKSIAIGGAGKDIKSLPNQMDKAWTIYDAMCDIGRQLSAKGYSSATHQPSQITQFIKGIANDTLPVGDDIASACSDQEMTIPEWCSFMLDPPDILLEKELVWPVEPDLMY